MPQAMDLLADACPYVCVFFFSSRRRHTRFDCDWSSDVCSSDLEIRRNGRKEPERAVGGEEHHRNPDGGHHRLAVQIGRASCRERVYISALAARLKKTSRSMIGVWVLTTINKLTSSIKIARSTFS